ncbi:MAG: DUF2256 and DUF3253 domain-containing protein [Myxococcota bacterium]
MTPEKPCVSCGRVITYRKKWRNSWDEVKYCSDACRRAKVSPRDEALEAAILDLLEARKRGATICPSEAARRVAPRDWRRLMEPARRAARRLVARGAIVITQKGRVVDPSSAKGPIRLRRSER